MNFFKTMTGLAMLMALLAHNVGCRPKTKTAERPAVAVHAVEAGEATIPVMVRSFGRLRASYEVNITPQVSGKIVAAPFTEGTIVEQGAILFQIEPDIYQAVLDQAAAQLASAEAALSQKRATLERNQKLLKQALIAQEDFDRLASDADIAAAQVDLCRAAHTKALIDLNYCTITAPVTGRTGKRQVDPGNVVSAAGGQILVNLRVVDPLFLDFTLSEPHVPALRAAMAAGEVKLLIAAEARAGTHGLHGGTLQLIDNTVDAQSGSIALRALVPNAESKLWPGQFVYAFPALDMRTNAVIVPQSAISDGKNGAYAFVINDNKAELRMVERGPTVGEAIVINKGLTPGELVVTAGQLGLWQSAPVQLKTEFDETTKLRIQKKLADPNTHALIYVLLHIGTDIEQTAIIVGLPEEHIKAIADKIKALP